MSIGESIVFSFHKPGSRITVEGEGGLVVGPLHLMFVLFDFGFGLLSRDDLFST